MKLNEDQELIYDKIKNAKDLMNGFFEMIEKTFDALFEIEWEATRLRVKVDEKVESLKKSKKPRKSKKLEKDCDNLELEEEKN